MSSALCPQAAFALWEKERIGGAAILAMIKWPCGITYETKVVVQNTIVKQPGFNSRSLHYSQAYKPPITRTNQHIILHIKKVRERAPRYHLQRYLWFLNESIISKRKKYSGFCKILISVPQHGKITWSNQASSNHILTISLLWAEL